MNAQTKQTNNLAVVSLVCGILGWTVVPWLGSLIAIVTGHMARAEIRRNPDTQEGDGMAVAGLALGWAMVLLTVLAILAVVLLLGGFAAFIAWAGAHG